MPVCRRLIPDEVVSRVEAIVTNKDETRLTDYFCGDVAQTFIDGVQEVSFYVPSLQRRGLIAFTPWLLHPQSRILNQALDLPGLSPPLRRKCLSALCHICCCRALLPGSLQIPLCYNRLEVPRCRGGFADVWMGYYRGQRVAAKALRVYVTSDFKKIRRVSCLYIILDARIGQLTVTRAEVLQGSDKVEGS